MATVLLWLITTLALAVALPAAWTQLHVVDADGLTVRYDQVSGPFATQEPSTLVGGSLGVVLRPDGDGLYAFRIVASDGFFNAVANVSISIGSNVVAEPADLLIATPPLPSGPTSLPTISLTFCRGPSPCGIIQA